VQGVNGWEMSGSRFFVQAISAPVPRALQVEIDRGGVPI
jgi:hypothetical protein